MSALGLAECLRSHANNFITESIDEDPMLESTRTGRRNIFVKRNDFSNKSQRGPIGTATKRILQAREMGKHNHVTTTYYLFVEKKKRNGGILKPMETHAGFEAEIENDFAIFVLSFRLGLLKARGIPIDY